MRNRVKKIKNKSKKHLTAGRGEVDFQQSREILTRETRDTKRRPVGSNHIRSSRTERLSIAGRNRPASASGDLRTVHFNTQATKNNPFREEEVVSGPARKDVTAIDNQVYDSKSAAVVKPGGVDNQKTAPVGEVSGKPASLSIGEPVKLIVSIAE